MRSDLEGRLLDALIHQMRGVTRVRLDRDRDRSSGARKSDSGSRTISAFGARDIEPQAQLDRLAAINRSSEAGTGSSMGRGKAVALYRLEPLFDAWIKAAPLRIQTPHLLQKRAHLNGSRKTESSKSFQEAQANWTPLSNNQGADIAANVLDETVNIVSKRASK